MKKYITFLGLSLMSGLAYSQVGINTQNPQGIFNVDGGKNNATTGTPTASQQKDDFVILADGSVGVGTTQPNLSAILDLNVSAKANGEKKGFLAPRVSLASRTDQATILNPAVGLLVYNIPPTTGGLRTEGYHYWNGSEWRALTSNTSIDPTIQTLRCADARFNPPQFTAGVPYSGVMIVPYSGGNGGSYGAGTPIASTGNTGLTATLRAGTLANGDGEFIYDLTGVPAQSSPNAANFAITVLGQSCSVSLTGDLLQVGETYGYVGQILELTMAVNEYANQYLTDLPVLEGLRIDLQKLNNSSYKPLFYNTSSSSVAIVTNATNMTNGASTANPKITVAAGAYYDPTAGTNTSWHPNTARSTSFNIIINNKRWYIVNYYCVSDSASPTASDYHNIRFSITRLQ
ncbi:hypothetical protein [Chryseobacterium oranimense]|uniref:hypothetical protein n=1 Tax=Chryseobacterium oranimense TaxID=421058 RepID=UPI0031CE2AAB